MVKLGIIGLGMAWERLHYDALMRLKGKINIIAVCDVDMQKAQKAAEMAQLQPNKIYTDYNKMITTETLDAVLIMVPIEENYNVAKAALEKGLSIIAEKPFAATEKGAQELIKLSKRKKVLVAENMRYDEGTAIIKKLIDERKIGNVVYFIDNNVCEFQLDMHKDSFAAKEWRQHPDFRGGIFLDSGVHNIARMRHLFGEVEQVFAAGRPTEADFCPYSCINTLLMFSGGVTGHYSYFNIAKETQRPLVGFRIFGTEGEIYLEEKDCGFVNLSLKDGTHSVLSYTPGQGYYNELMNFYNAIENNEEITSTPENELGDIVVINDILDSIESIAKTTPAPRRRKRSC